MAKLTVLDLVQDVLSDMDSDPVNSISDTVEAFQVAKICESVYNQVTANRNWPLHETLLKFDSSTTTDRPTHTRLPVDVKEISNVFYDVRKQNDENKRYREIHYLYPDEFLLRTNNRVSTNNNVDVIQDVSGVELLIKNDIEPQWWTSFDDDYIVFDSYNNVVDSTIQSSKLQVTGIRIPVFQVADDFIPDIPDEAFPMYLAKVKSNAFRKLKQEVSPLDEEETRLQQNWLARKAWRAKGGVRYPDYSRRRGLKGTFRKNPQFDKYQSTKN